MPVSIEGHELDCFCTYPFLSTETSGLVCPQWLVYRFELFFLEIFSSQMENLVVYQLRTLTMACEHDYF